MARHRIKTTGPSIAMGAAIAALWGCAQDSPQDPVTSSTGMGSDAVSTAVTALDGSGSGSTGAVACAGIQGEGHAVGQISPNWTLTDASGASVQLHDYCGKVIYIESGAEW